MQAPRFCRKCNGPRAWTKKRDEGARASRFECVDCHGPTKRIKGQRKKLTMSPKAYDQRQKVKDADDLWRQIIYAKAKNGQCARCGRKRPLQACHNISRRYLSTRHDPDNGAPCCAGCHMETTRDHDKHLAFFVNYLGEETYERIRLRSIGRSKTDMDLVLMSLRRLLVEKELEGKL